MILKSKYFM